MDKKLYEQAMQTVLEKIEVNLDTFRDRFPHVSKDLKYVGEENRLWTAGFWPGMNYLAYQYTGDNLFLQNSEIYLDSFTERLERGHTETHDLGFLYTLSSVALFKLTGSKRAEDLARRAAHRLTHRYHAQGKYIQAWGKIGLTYPDVKIIIDTMLNLPLLYWAGANSEAVFLHEIAKNHAGTAMRYLIRDDASSYHTYLMNPEDGSAVTGKTHQGHRDESTWARGQAWSIYGFVLSYLYTREERFLQVAQKTADWFLEHLPEDRVPYWDFDFTDTNQDIKDSSAAAIAVSGLLEIGRQMPGNTGERYRLAGEQILTSLVTNYLDRRVEVGCGLLLEGMYHRNDGAREFTAWGDYFFMEALMRVLGDSELFW